MLLSAPKTAQYERARVAALRRYGILETSPEAAFDRVVALCQHAFKTPLVLLSFIDETRHWLKAAHGLEPGRRVKSIFCRETLYHAALTLPDVSSSGFQKQRGVQGLPDIRAYLGVSLKTPDGYAIGTLCVMDRVPRPDFGSEATALLGDFAALAQGELELRLARRALAEGAAQTDAILASIAQAFVTFDRNWHFTSLNPQAERLLGRSRSDLLGQYAWDIFPEVLTAEPFKSYVATLERGEPLHAECFFTPLGFWLEVNAYPTNQGFSAYLQNIGARKASEARLETQSAFQRKLLTFTQRSLEVGLSEGFYQELLNVAVDTIPGAQAGSLLIRKGTKHYFAAAVGYDLSALQACVFDEEESPTSLDLERLEPQHIYDWPDDELSAAQREVMERDGRTREIKVTLCVPIAVHGKSVVSLYLDNFEAKEAFDTEATLMAQVLAQQAATVMQRLELETALELERAALTRLAHFDPLTGLPNRHLFDDRLGNASAQARRTGRALAVLLLGLDHFKDINDVYGHHVGDSVIAAAAARLAPLIREGDTLARWAGDEFIALFPHIGGPDEAERLTHRMVQALQQPFSLGGLELEVHASSGVALYPEGTEVASDLVKHASIALYQAKKQHLPYMRFNHSLQQALKQRIELETELRTALTKRTLTLYYQPRVQLSDGSVTSLEALARWFHPQRGFIPPSVFIPLAEASGLIHELGLQVLDQACAQAKRWQRDGLDRRVAVNLSVEQLRHPQIVREVEKALARNELDAKWLELEVTESTAMSDVAGNILKLQLLRDLGVRLAIDDFGTAYSSLAYIERLPVHCLKIDRSFLQNVAAASKRDTRVVEAVLALARSFELEVVAEGVETEAQRQTLLELGCLEAQGYLFAAPMDAEKATAFLLSTQHPRERS